MIHNEEKLNKKQKYTKSKYISEDILKDRIGFPCSVYSVGIPMGVNTLKFPTIPLLITHVYNLNIVKIKIM